MKRIAPAALAAALLTLTAATPPAREPAPGRTAGSTAAKRGEWPDTPAAAMGRGWVEAFGKGERAMREFLEKNMAPEELAVRGVDARLETYRANLERFGALMLVSVDSSGTTGIKVTLAASDLSQQRFSFFTQPKPPYRLARVYRTETRTSHGGFGH